jgi:hypothetical protein
MFKMLDNGKVRAAGFPLKYMFADVLPQVFWTSLPPFYELESGKVIEAA